MQLALQLPGTDGNVTIDNPPGFFTDKFKNLSSIVSEALPYLFAISGLLLFAYLVWGGFDYLTSMGDEKKAEAARGKITHAILGFIIIFAAYWLVQIADAVFKMGIYQ